MLQFNGYISVLLLPYSLSSGELGSSDLILSYSVITLALHISIILIITHLSTPKSTDTGTENVVVGRGYNFCIVDEADSILMDEARTPLIISRKGQAPTDKYLTCAEISKNLFVKEHYEVSEKDKRVEVSLSLMDGCLTSRVCRSVCLSVCLCLCGPCWILVGSLWVLVGLCRTL